MFCRLFLTEIEKWPPFIVSGIRRHLEIINRLDQYKQLTEKNINWNEEEEYSSMDEPDCCVGNIDHLFSFGRVKKPKLEA